MSGATAYSVDTEPLTPNSLYPLTAFIRHSGISKSRISAARQQGTLLTTIKVGKRVFVRGSDGIAFIEKLAQEGGAA